MSASNQRTISRKPKKGLGVKRRHRFNPVVVAIFLVLFLAAGAVIYMVVSGNYPFSGKKDDPAKEQSTKTEKSESSENDQKSEAEKSKESEVVQPREDGKDQNPQYEGENANTYENLTGAVNSLDFSGSSATVRIMISQYLSSGTCSVTLTSPSGKVYSGATDVAVGPSSSSCTLTISAAKESGSWDVSANVKSADKSGTISGKIPI